MVAEMDIFNSLNDLGWAELSETDLHQSIKEGVKSIKFTKLVEWVTKELKYLYNLDEHVNAITSPDDSSLFVMELGSFLREIGCQYSEIMEGHIKDNLQLEPVRKLLLEYLLTELKSARMLHLNKPDNGLSVTINESDTATDLKNMLLVMKFPKPPADIPPELLFSKVETKLKEILSKVPPVLLSAPLFTGKLSDKNWHKLENFYKELNEEYRIRREMLLKRLDVTIQSFEWSDRLKNKSNEIHSSFEVSRKLMTIEPNVRLSDVLAARKDLAILEKTSSASVRQKTKSDVNKVVIGMVPDRGGRPYEQEPPPPEMPSWQQRSSGGGRGGGRGGSANRGGGRGGGSFGGDNFNKGGERGRETISSGRVQASWNAPQNTGYQNNQNQTFERQSSGSGYSKNYQSQGVSQNQYRNNSNHENRGGRGGYRGGYQNIGFHQDDYQNRRGYQGNQRGGGYRDYY